MLRIKPSATKGLILLQKVKWKEEEWLMSLPPSRNSKCVLLAYVVFFIFEIIVIIEVSNFAQFKTAQLLATRLYESFIGKYIILPILALLALALIWSYVYAKYADFVTSHSIIDDYQWIETSDVEGAVEHWLLWRLPLVSALIISC